MYSAAKEVLRGKYLTLNAYIRKKRKKILKSVFYVSTLRSQKKFGGFSKSLTELPHDPAVLLLKIYPTYIHIKTHTYVFIAT